LVDKIIWISYKDKVYCYRDQITTTTDYEYDANGLLYIYRANEGETWSDEKSIIYDREKEMFLRNFTISKSSYISVESSHKDNLLEFIVPDNCYSMNCKRCGQLLTFIAKINLLEKKLNIKNIKMDCIPILFCFGCQDSHEYNIGELKTKLIVREPFVKNNYQFKRSNDEEKIEEALFKLGGSPVWIQNEEYPHCRVCKKLMKYVMEINTNEELNSGEIPLAFGDCGKLYVFACCEEVNTLMQCY
jgi:hypothetical protein